MSDVALFLCWQWQWVHIHVEFITDVELKLEYGSALPQKSSMCSTDADYFTWWNSVCWMGSMKEVKKWEDKISLSSLVCIRQSLLTLSICQLPGFDFPLPKNAYVYFSCGFWQLCSCEKQRTFIPRSVFILTKGRHLCTSQNVGLLDFHAQYSIHTLVCLFAVIAVKTYICVAGYKHCGWKLRQVIGSRSGRESPAFPLCWFLVRQAKQE